MILSAKEVSRSNMTYNVMIFILLSEGIDLVPNGLTFSFLVQKDQLLNLTCYAAVGCNDIGYDIEFSTNLTSSEYKVIMNIPDRSKCFQNFNEISNFTKSIIIPKVSVNGTMVQCYIKFGPQLKTDSPQYHIYFAGKFNI